MAAPYTRETNITGATNLNRELTWGEGDENMGWIISQFNALVQNTGLEAYNSGTTYSGTRYVSYSQNIYKHISSTPTTGVTPGTDGTKWQLTSIGQLVHAQGSDEYLAQGTDHEVSAQDLFDLLNSVGGITTITSSQAVTMIEAAAVVVGRLYLITTVGANEDEFIAIGADVESFNFLFGKFLGALVPFPVVGVFDGGGAKVKEIFASDPNINNRIILHKDEWSDWTGWAPIWNGNVNVKHSTFDKTYSYDLTIDNNAVISGLELQQGCLVDFSGVDTVITNLKLGAGALCTVNNASVISNVTCGRSSNVTFDGTTISDSVIEPCSTLPFTGGTFANMVFRSETVVNGVTAGAGVAIDASNPKQPVASVTNQVSRWTKVFDADFATLGMSGTSDVKTIYTAAAGEIIEDIHITGLTNIQDGSSNSIDLFFGDSMGGDVSINIGGMSNVIENTGTVLTPMSNMVINGVLPMVMTAGQEITLKGGAGVGINLASFNGAIKIYIKKVTL